MNIKVSSLWQVCRPAAEVADVPGQTQSDPVRTDRAMLQRAGHLSARGLPVPHRPHRGVRRCPGAPGRWRHRHRSHRLRLSAVRWQRTSGRKEMLRFRLGRWDRWVKWPHITWSWAEQSLNHSYSVTVPPAGRWVFITAPDFTKNRNLTGSLWGPKLMSFRAPDTSFIVL